MAEGGNFSRTLEGGSEALFDHECSLCSTDSLKKEATDFCQDCKEFLCKMCGLYHIRYMKTHSLVSIASLQQSKIIPPTKSPVRYTAKCQNHPDFNIEMYCGTYDKVYFCLCIAIAHRSCSDVKDIADVAHKSNMSTLQSLVAEITRVIKRLHTTKLEMSNDLKLIQKMKTRLLDEIKALRRIFNEQLDALEQKIIAELDEEENKLEKEISDDISTVDDLIIASDKSKSDMTSQVDRKQIFITEKLGKVVLADANNFLKKANVLNRPTLQFEPDDILSDAIEKSDRMGTINIIDSKLKRTQRSNYTENDIIDIKH